ncbi:MAG: hypothetical protein HOM87_05110 [Proteobacteria bacterium]|nr:hypothetical protein [Pseudomonadota bacterium]
MIPVITVKRFLVLSLILAIGFFSRSSFAQSVSDASACRADVVFLMDNTGSMGGPITSTKRNAQSILDAISGGDPRFAGIDTHYGVSTYWGDPREYLSSSTIWFCHRDTCPWSWCNRYICENPSGYCARYWPSQCISREPTEAQKKAAAQKAFRINQPLTDSKALTRRGMSEWRPCSSPGGCGGDWAEANFFGLHQLATGGASTDGMCIDPPYPRAPLAECADKGFSSGYNINWRQDSGRIVVWFGDACSWTRTVDKTEVIQALQANNVVVAGINSGRSGRGIDHFSDAGLGSCMWGSEPGQAASITEATGGSLTNSVSGTSDTINAILDAVAGGMAQSGSAAAVSFNVSSITEDTRIYQSFFNAKDWSGDLIAYDLNEEDGSIGDKVWSAADRLDRQGTGSRTILTLGKQRGRIEGVPLVWGQLTSEQQNDLRTEPNGALGNVSKGVTRLQYLRGSRTHEGKGFGYRVRGSVLGDIWHSSAVYVGAPQQPWPDSGRGFPTGANKYSSFAASQQNRTPVVYVGANDGFLHGFSATRGEELIAYAPGNLFSTRINAGYHRLTDPNFNHNSLYVDGTPTISDAYIKTGRTEQWRTVLAGIQGGGGRGLFALDITDPDTFRESNASDIVLWEFTDQHDAHLGYTFSKPTIVLLNNGRWAVITGNGLDDSATDGTGGQSQLFIIYLDGGLDGIWTYGTDYIRIPTGVGSISDRNGLFSPAVIDLDNNGTADRVYAGDLNGHLWTFDLSSQDQNLWGLAYGSRPLFTGSASQSITIKPTVAKHPTDATGKDPNLMIFFGTGQFLKDADKTLTGQQSFYAIWDVAKADLTRADLATQQFLLNDASKKARVLNPRLKVEYELTTGKQYGWVIDLPSSGERVIAEALIRGDLVFFNTVIPDISVCASGGSGWEMSVKMENGGSPESPVFDFNEDGVIAIKGDTASVSGIKGKGETGSPENIGYAGKKLEEEQGMPAGPSIIGNRRFTPGSGTDEVSKIEDTLLQSNVSRVSGRLSWEHLFPD